ncbi:TPA: tetratricopeptide repeat protein, partial [Candidatus Poribacteria bacterium]|nr:tetratricopeptide repeat protein [Candidatus Poribacteria bacterium]
MMPRNNGLRLQAFATTGPLGRKIILVIQFFSLCVLWFTGCSTNIKDVASNLELINGKPSEYQQAITEFERVIEINPESEWSHYNLGLVHYNQGEYQQAIKQFERVIEINPESEWSHYNLGLVHYNQGE